MDIVEIPVVPIGQELKTAIKVMRQAERSAVIGTSESGDWLFKAREVVIGMSKGHRFLNELPLKRSVGRPSFFEKVAFALDYARPHNSSRNFETFLDEKKFSYAIAKSTSATALLVTRHEHLAVEIGLGPKDCYCTNENIDPPHDFPPPPAPADGKCPYCGYPVTCDF
jgi:hypothetical protein